MSQQEMADFLGITRQGYGKYENGGSQPSFEMLEVIADYFDVTTDYLLGRSDKKESDWNTKLPELTERDEKDIAKDLEDMLNNLNTKDGYAAFDGRSMDDMDEEDVELLKASLENSLRMAKRMAKQKFTPKKYRE